MKKLALLIVGMLFMLASCGKKEKQTEMLVQNKPVEAVKGQTEAYELLKLRCYACHNPKAKSHDEIIAPPLVAVKRRYGIQFKSREEFVNAIVNWAIDPTKEKALMFGAVNRFNVMPKQLFKEDELHKIAGYIYDNEIEEPEWFAEHEKEMHGPGKRGRGIDRGMGRMKSKD